MKARFCFFLKACFLTLLTTQAFALGASEARWNGFYVGANIGSVRSNIKMQTSVAPGGSYFDYTQDAPQLAAAGDDNLSQWRFSGGLLGGYEHQFNHLLLGAEISANNLSINASQSTSDTFYSVPSIRFVVKQSMKADWEGTLRLRLGFAENQWMAYVTGGAAMTSLKYTSSYSDDNAYPGLPGASGTGTASKIKYGGVIGAGSEYAFNDAWGLKVEYLYSDFGNVKTAYTIVPTPALSEFSSEMNGKADFIVQSFIVGLTYRF